MATSEAVVMDLTSEAREKLNSFLNGKNAMNILFTGKTGVGKSSLANALVGREVSPEGETLNPETMDVFEYKADIMGIDVTIWDSPGLQDGTSNEAKYLENIAAKCKGLDLVLYCTRMDDARMRDEDHEAVRVLTGSFGEAIWKNAIFTLTFANKVRKTVRSRSRNTATPVDQKEFFTRRLTEWETKLKEVLAKAGVSHQIVHSISVVPVGYQDDLCLPDRENWLSSFWLACLMRINERATLALLKVNSDRPTHEAETIKELMPSPKPSHIATGAAFGAVAGSIIGPPGSLLGAAFGVAYGGMFSLLVQMIQEEIKMGKKEQ